MKLSVYFKSSCKKSLASCAEEIGVNTSVFHKWFTNKRRPSTNINMRRLFLWSKGEVEPNDFFPIDEWRRELAEIFNNDIDNH